MKKGQVFIIQEGDGYEDSEVATLVALHDFSFDVALARWIADHGEIRTSQSKEEFAESLRARGAAKDLEVWHLHLGNYSEPAEPHTADDEADELLLASRTPPPRD